MATPARSYTRSEKLKLTRLLVQGAKQSAGDVSGNERQIDRINERAEERARHEAEAHQRLIARAKQEVAEFRVAERAASGAERSAARQQRREAEKRLRAAERSAPRT